MAIFNEKYVSKYAFINDDDDIDNDTPSKPIKYFNRTEIYRIINIIKKEVSKFPKLAKCCEYVELEEKDDYDDDARRVSPMDRYFAGGPGKYLKVIEGDVWPGYPDFNSNGSNDYENDRHDLIKSVNKSFKEKNIPAIFTYGSTSSDESISLGIKSIKT